MTIHSQNKLIFDNLNGILLTDLMLGLDAFQFDISKAHILQTEPEQIRKLFSSL